MIIIEHLLDISRFKKIVFLDRDGVINVNMVNYLTSKSDIEIINQSVEAMEMFWENNVGIVIITNQQAIGKGIITVSEAVDIHLEVLNKLNIKFSPIIASYICPHLKSDNCKCRKPDIKMIKTAEKMFDIDLRDNYFIGDSLVDMRAAENAGLKPLYIGKHAEIIELGKKVHCFNNLFEASEYVCCKLV